MSSPSRSLPIPAAEASALLATAPRAYTTRNVPRSAQRRVVSGTPRTGDLVLVRIDSIGSHRRIHLPDGRRQNLFTGDVVVVAYADRYAPKQFEAVVPADLGPCHLVAAGGVAAEALSWHDRVRRGPTEITPLGLVAAADDAPPLNVADFTLAPPGDPVAEPAPVIAFFGTAMDSGKTTSAAYLARGLHRAGLRVGFAKVTGTGAGGDPFLMRDAGADPVLDFTDVGWVSTWKIGTEAVEDAAIRLTEHLRAEPLDVILLEVADGLLQAETAALLESARFGEVVDGVILAATDAMGAAFGVERIRASQHELLAVTGMLTAAPLQVREALYTTGAPVVRTDSLLDPTEALKVVGPIGVGGARA